MTERTVPEPATPTGTLEPTADPQPRESAAAVAVVDPAETAFRAGTIRIPLRGEEAYAEKVPVVVAEVVITKRLIRERHVVHGTVRIERAVAGHSDARPRLAAA